MSYSVDITAYCKKQIKHLLKKYPSLKQELTDIIDSLEINPVQGTGLGNDCYKIRVSIASKNKGKSGGARLIINVHFANEKVYMLSMYDKSEQENISDAHLRELLKYIL